MATTAGRGASAGVRLSYEQVAVAAWHAGFRGLGLVHAIAISFAESGGNPHARGVNTDSFRSVDRGPWQINNHWHPEVSDSCAYDLNCSAKAAFRISNGGKSWTPWATWNNGAYKSFLGEAGSAAAKVVSGNYNPPGGTGGIAGWAAQAKQLLGSYLGSFNKVGFNFPVDFTGLKWSANGLHFANDYMIGTHAPGATGPPNWQSDSAVDIFAPEGTPVRAPFSGLITTDYNALGGNSFELWNGSGNNKWQAYGAHLHGFAKGFDKVSTPKRVKAGDIIGYVGHTGSGGQFPSHLHFAFARNGSPVNPFPFLHLSLAAGGAAQSATGGNSDGGPSVGTILVDGVSLAIQGTPGVNLLADAAGGAGSVVNDGVSAAQGTADAVGSIASSLGWIFKPENALRVVFIVGAILAVILAGILLITQGNKGGAATVAKVAAE